MESIHFYTRGKKLYIYAKYENHHRIRLSTGLKNDDVLALDFLKKNYQWFLKDKTEVLKAFHELKYPKIEIKKEGKIRIIKDDFKSLIENLLKEKANLKINTQKSYKNIFKDIKDFLEFKKIRILNDFSRTHCVEYMQYLKNKNNKNSTIKLKMSILKHLLKYALDLELIPKNPFFMPKISVEEEDLKEFKPFNLDQIKLLIKNAKDELKSFLIVAFFTGARTGELLGLKYEDINLKESKAHIKRTLGQDKTLNTPKTKSSYRIIDLLPIVSKELQNFFKRKELMQDFLFKKSRIKLREEFKALQKRLNINPLRRLYDTRHSFASVMLNKGEEALWISKIMLGHSNLNQTFKSYAKYLPQNTAKRALFLKDLKFD